MGKEQDQRIVTGKDRRAAEAGRIARLKHRAAAPDGCSDAVPLAPAAAPSVVFRHKEGVMTESGPRMRATTHAGSHAARRCEPLEVMERLAARSGAKTAIRFTPSQHAAAVAYVALFEGLAASDMKLSSFEGGVGGGDSLGRRDRYSVACDRMRRMVAAIGARPVLSPRGRAAQLDRGRQVLLPLDVMNGVLVHGLSISGVLARAHWGRQTPYVKAAQAALCASLDAIYGL